MAQEQLGARGGVRRSGGDGWENGEMAVAGGEEVAWSGQQAIDGQEHRAHAGALGWQGPRAGRQEHGTQADRGSVELSWLPLLSAGAAWPTPVLVSFTFSESMYLRLDLSTFI